MIKNIWSKVSYAWFIFMLVIVGFFCGALKVNGATVSKATDMWALQFCSDRTCDYTIGGSTYYRDYANVNSSSYTNSNHYYLTAIRLRQTFNSSNYLQAGTMYQFKYKLHFNPKYNLSYYQTNMWGYDFTITDTSNNSTTLDDGTYSCSLSNINNSDTAFFLTCLYTPTTNLKQVYIRLTFPFTTYVDYSGYSGYIFKSMNVINYTSSLISYNSSSTDAINEQTNTIINQTNTINNSVNDVNDSINNDDVENPSSMISDFEDMLPTNGVITNLIALPINMYTKIIDSINGTCSPIQLPFYRTENSSGSVTSYVTFPCKTLAELTSVQLSDIIDIIISGFMIYHISKKMVKAFHNFTSMKEGDVIND